MKKQILIVLIALALPCIVSAEDYWVDVNFTRDSVFWGQGTMPPQPDYQVYDNREFTGGFIIHGNFGRWNSTWHKLNAEDRTEKFIMSDRLSRSNNNQIVLPRTPDVSRLKIHFFNTNTDYDAYIPIQKNIAPVGEPFNWVDFEPALELYVPINDGSNSTFYVDTLLNLDESQLRLTTIRNPYLTDQSKRPNVQIYAISISKRAPSNVSVYETENVKMNLTGKSLKISGIESDFKASIYNLAGNKIGVLSNDGSFSFQESGVFLVEISTAMGNYTKKIAVL